MKQQTLAMARDRGFEQYRKPTRREQFLETMDRIVPWKALCGVVEPFYPKAGNGRPPIGLERMLRLHFLQHWFNLADQACEEALYDSASLRCFAGLALVASRCRTRPVCCGFVTCWRSTSWARNCLPQQVGYCETAA